MAALVLFLGFWLLNDPGGLADTAQSSGGAAWSATEDVFSAVIDFVDEL